MRKRILWLGLSFLLVAALVLSSCGPAVEEGEQEEEEEEEEEQEEEEEEEEEVVVPVAGEPQRGGTLVYCYSSSWEPPNFDPHSPFSPIHAFCDPFLQRLLVGDIEGQGPRGTNEYTFRVSEFVPVERLTGELAESYEWLNPETVVFHIRPGCYWRGNENIGMEPREFTAYDAEFSIRRYKTMAGEFRIPYVTDITATDKYTLVLKLDCYSANWGYDFVYGWSNQLACPESVEAGIEDWRNAVGIGPFRITNYTSGVGATYVANPDYWRKTTIDGKEYKIPFIEKLIYAQIPDVSTQIAALRTAAVDIHAAVYTQYMDTLMQTSPGLLHVPTPAASTPFIAMRTDLKPFDDIRVRIAMNLALDKQGMLDKLYFGSGSIHCCPLIADFDSFYIPIDELPKAARWLVDYDPVEARRLLEDALGPPSSDGLFFKTDFVTGADAVSVDRASMMVAYWEDIGVTCEIRPMETSAYHSYIYAKQQTGIGGIPTIGTNPYKGFRWWLPGDQHNAANWNEPLYEAMYWDTVSTQDPDEHIRKMKEMTLYLYDQVLWLNVPSAQSHIFWWPWLQNYYGELVGGFQLRHTWMATLWIDQDMKKEMGY